MLNIMINVDKNRFPCAIVEFWLFRRKGSIINFMYMKPIFFIFCCCKSPNLFFDCHYFFVSIIIVPMDMIAKKRFFLRDLLQNPKQQNLHFFGFPYLIIFPLLYLMCIHHKGLNSRFHL